jgi:hypothetical protein
LYRKEEIVKKSYLILGAALLCGGMAVAQTPTTKATQPVENINPHKHSNLAAAQRKCQEAYDKISAAQQANEFDMQGHAKKAKELLDQANQELKQAAESANMNHK